MRRRNTRLRSVWGAVVVYLAVGVPVARVGHEATAHHRYCAEHHAMEEARSAGSNQRSGAPLAPSNHDHETCPFTPLAGQLTLSPAPVAAPVPAPPAIVLAQTPNSAPAARAGAVLSVAPKTSPPA